VTWGIGHGIVVGAGFFHSHRPREYRNRNIREDGTRGRYQFAIGIKITSIHCDIHNVALLRTADDTEVRE
jgi:hypothetical protein